MNSDEIAQGMIAELLRARTGQHLSDSRRWRIRTTLSGVLRERGLTNLDQLACLLAEPNSDALACDIVEALLNNETYFYRDRPMFDLLTNTVLPDLASRRGNSRRLRVWSAGCSTGQEVYTLAMIFAERPAIWRDWHIEIVGTDISGQAIEAARKAEYSQFEIQRGLGIDQMLKWFREEGRVWVPVRALRESVRFEQRNILQPPGSRDAPFDLVLCRNVLLYFDHCIRNRAFARLDAQLAQDGWLMLGAGETVVGRTGTFEPVGRSQGLCRKRSLPKNIWLQPETLRKVAG